VNPVFIYHNSTAAFKVAEKPSNYGYVPLQNRQLLLTRTISFRQFYSQMQTLNLIFFLLSGGRFLFLTDNNRQM